ncbi:MAG: phosphatase PAP2 family protein [Bacteroidales bacterium]|nr:phosphatase PAP2 family protein [Bacteroidales bacterium]
MALLKDIFNRNRFFFVPFFITFIFLAFPLVLFDKHSLHLFINKYHCVFTDYFFKYITNLGDGLFAAGVGVLYLLVSFRKSFFILSSYLMGGLVVQLFKRLIFTGSLRPVKYFEGIFQLHLVDGVQMREYLSFPSGHAATAFGLFLCLAVISGNNFVKSICVVMAIVVSFSRVYLSQHFLIDIYSGSLIGVICTLIIYKYVFLTPSKWADKGLVHMITNKKRIENES